MRVLIGLILLLIALTACQSTQTVVQRVPCLLPDDLKQRDQMSDHPEVETPAVPDGGEAWAKDRAKGAEGWKRHNDTVDFVERECK